MQFLLYCLLALFQMMKSKCSSQKDALEDAEDVVLHMYYRTKLQTLSIEEITTTSLKTGRFYFHFFS